MKYLIVAFSMLFCLNAQAATEAEFNAALTKTVDELESNKNKDKVIPLQAIDLKEEDQLEILSDVSNVRTVQIGNYSARLITVALTNVHMNYFLTIRQEAGEMEPNQTEKVKLYPLFDALDDYRLADFTLDAKKSKGDLKVINIIAKKAGQDDKVVRITIRKLQATIEILK